MRKAFKVATVFTGAAACATTFVPAAGAATVRPATSHWDCSIGPRTTATVLWWPTSKDHGPTCVGGANQNHESTPLGTIYTSYCPGDNFGYIYTSSPAVYYRVHPGETKHEIYAYVTSVYISSWSKPASKTCATT
jgi:hypothetical protein